MVELTQGNSVLFEQVAVIKFLVQEKSSDYEIFCRLRKVYLNETLSKQCVNRVFDHFNSKYGDFKDGVHQIFDQLKEEFSNACLDQTSEPSTSNKKTNYYEETTECSAKLMELHDHEQVGFLYEGDDDHKEKLVEKAIQRDRIFTLNDGSEQLNVKLPFLPNIKSDKLLSILLDKHSGLRCLLCPSKNFNHICRLKTHLQRVHLRHSIPLERTRTLLCKLPCQRLEFGHYHCPVCSRVERSKKRLFMHYQCHYSRQKRPDSDKYRLDTHAFTESIPPVCIDPMEGIYLVRKSKFSDIEPIHVRKNFMKDINECSLPICNESMALARAQGKNLECKHLLEVDETQDYEIKYFDFQPKYYSLFSELNSDQIQRCNELVSYAEGKEVSPIAEWSISGNSLIYLSVVSDSPSDSMGRVLVVFDSVSKLYSCSCCEMDEGPCVYKIIASTYVDWKYS